MSLTAREALITLNLIPGLGPVRIMSLLEHFGTAELVLAAPKELLRKVPRVGDAIAAAIADWRHCTQVHAELECAQRAGVRITTLFDDEYPDALRSMSDPPVVLYSLGEWKQEDALRAVAVVGTRMASPYGLNCARNICRELADSSGCCIISGLARGIDTAAHLGALEGQGRTIAVLGGGLSSIFPQENMDLARRIAGGNGAIVSEFPMNMSPSRNTFPQRNRIVAAWCRATVVVEAGQRSGALHTAGLAAEYGKSVFAVPGHIGSASSIGCHRLIRDGAVLCSSAADIISDMGWDAPQQKNLPLFDPPAAEQDDPILAAVRAGHCTLDALCSALGTSAGELTPRLMQLQILRKLRPISGGRYEAL